MAITNSLEKFFKWLLLISLIVMTGTYFFKDKLPEPSSYDLSLLKDPKQTATSLAKFTTEVNGEKYVIEPKYDYELSGVIVSYNNSDGFGDIWHHDRWKDFINLRDLCVVWGNNVASGVYEKMKFSNDSWTCWAFWPDAATGEQFTMAQLSNNHLLSNDAVINRALMAAEPGDHIRLKGALATYSNPGNGFHRGTSTVRTDTGNGACETIYVQDFQILKKANMGARRLYNTAKWTGIISLSGFLLMFVIAPVRIR